MKHEKKMKKLTEWPKRRVLRRLGPFSSSPPPPFLLSVIIKTYINNTYTLVSIKIRKKNLLLWPKQRVWRRLGLPPVMVLLWVMVAVSLLWLSRIVDPCLGCWLLLLLPPLSMRVLMLRFKLVLLMLFVVDTRDRSRDFKFHEHCVTG